MKECNAAKESMSLYIDRMLDDRSEAELLLHIETCETCRCELEELKVITGICADMKEVELPDDFNSKLHEKLATIADKENTSVRNIALRYRKIISICSSAAAVIIITLAMRGFFGDNAKFDNLARDYAGSGMSENGFSITGVDDYAKTEEGLSDKYTGKGSEKEVNTEQKSIRHTEALDSQRLPKPQTASFQMSFTEAVPSNRTDIEILVKEPEKEFVKLEEFAADTGASLLQRNSGNEGLTDENEDWNGDTGQALIVKYKIVNAKYGKFMDVLNANFPTLVVLKNADLELISKRIEEVEKSINDTDAEINNTTDSEKISQLKSMKAQLEAELEMLRQEYEYIIVSIELVQNEIVEQTVGVPGQ